MLVETVLGLLLNLKFFQTLKTVGLRESFSPAFVYSLVNVGASRQDADETV